MINGQYYIDIYELVDDVCTHNCSVFVFYSVIRV